jgi:hypothetical protein
MSFVSFVSFVFFVFWGLTTAGQSGPPVRDARTPGYVTATNAT